MARQPQYARRSTHRNKVVVGVNDPQAFQLSLNDSNADYTGAKIRQDPLILPYFGRTGVLCIPHWWRARFVRCMDIFKKIFKRVIICMDIFAAFLFRGDQLRFANRLCQACWCRCRHWVTGTGAAAPKWLTKREYYTLKKKITSMCLCREGAITLRRCRCLCSRPSRLRVGTIICSRIIFFTTARFCIVGVAQCRFLHHAARFRRNKRRR